jgi:methyl-accepting chemotaxis protein
MYRTTAQLVVINREARRANTVLVLLEQLMSKIKDAETSQRGYLLVGRPEYLEPYRAASPAIDTILRQLDEAIDNETQQSRLESLRPILADRLAVLKQTIDLGLENKIDAALELVKTDRGKAAMDELRRIGEEIRRTEQDQIERRNAEAEAAAVTTLSTVAIGGPLAAVLVIVTAVWLIRATTRPVRAAIQQLTTTGAELLASTSAQASGAQEQAAAVAETVATVDQVTQTADQSAQRARTVGETVNRTLAIGTTGRATVEQSITALEQLRQQVETTAETILALAEQAQAIGDIIATVTDIAEQTNLLALNAAIEASRAGEHGRSFAVVAGEVRALATQSKKATTQVRQILGEIQKATNAAVLSMEDVTKGVGSASRVTGEAGETIAALADTLSEMSRAAAQIAASAGQQAIGMTQIHQAMRNIDTVSKQNLAAVRQTEQAAADLNELGTKLMALVGR